MKRPMTLCLLVALVAVPARAEIKPANLPVNTADDEDEPHVSSNGLKLFYTSNANKKFEVFLSSRGETGKWTKGKLFLDLDSKANVRSVFLTPDGDKHLPQRLYFATDKDPTKKDEKGGNYDLYFITKQTPKSDFTFEEGLKFCTEEDELHPWLTPDGNSLYFSRKTKGGWRVYVSTRPKDGGQFGDPALIKELPPEFHHATLMPDGKTMYLQGPLDKGRWGLFRSTLGARGWGKPEALKELNNAAGPTGDRSPCLSRDGEWLYFASDRPDGKGGLDLYVVREKLLKN
jgi:Tol biopolymer transport system component